MPETGQARGTEEKRQAGAHEASHAFWQTRVLQKIASLLCLLAAAGLEYWLVNIPVGEVGSQFPATVRAGLQAVTFDKPALTEAGNFAFAYRPPTEAEPVTVDAYFDNAQLAPETQQALRSLQVSAPSSPGAAAYVTSAVKKGSCATKFEVAPISPPGSVRFAQSENDSLAGFRSIAVTVMGSDADVTLTSQGAMQNLLSPCKVELSVGSWKQTTGGFFPIKLRVAAGTNFRFRWQNLGEKSNTWDNKSAALPLLQFGSGGDEFTSSAIQIGSAKADPSTPLILEARAAKNGSLTVDSFRIDKDNLAINASGKGKVLKDGSVVTKTDVLEALKKDELLSTLFGIGNVALLGWAGRSWFPSRKKKRGSR